jgi:hypothetical protein
MHSALQSSSLDQSFGATREFTAIATYLGQYASLDRYQELDVADNTIAASVQAFAS